MVRTGKKEKGDAEMEGTSLSRNGGGVNSSIRSIPPAKRAVPPSERQGRTLSGRSISDDRPANIVSGGDGPHHGVCARAIAVLHHHQGVFSRLALRQHCQGFHV